MRALACAAVVSVALAGCGTTDDAHDKVRNTKREYRKVCDSAWSLPPDVTPQEAKRYRERYCPKNKRKRQ